MGEGESADGDGDNLTGQHLNGASEGEPILIIGYWLVGRTRAGGAK